jgi:hypothetical protein
MVKEIAGNYGNNFQYAPEWLWDKHLAPTDFVMYMALRSFFYPTGPTVDMLAEKTGWTPGDVQKSLWRLHHAELAERCLKDEYGEPCDDRWRFVYYKYVKDAPDQAPPPSLDKLDRELLRMVRWLVSHDDRLGRRLCRARVVRRRP